MLVWWKQQVARWRFRSRWQRRTMLSSRRFQGRGRVYSPFAEDGFGDEIEVTEGLEAFLMQSVIGDLEAKQTIAQTFTWLSIIPMHH